MEVWSLQTVLASATSRAQIQRVHYLSVTDGICPLACFRFFKQRMTCDGS